MVDVMERPGTADTVYTRRARYFDSGNAFNLVLPPVPGHAFTDEAARALDPATGTALIDCDQSAAMALDFPATTPLVLAHYARIRAGEALPFTSGASTELHYVIAGSGRSEKGADTIAWRTGDAFCLPGGGETVHHAGDEDCVLWIVTNAPQLAFERLGPPPADRALVQAAHYPAAEIERQLTVAEQRLEGKLAAGLAVVLSSERLEGIRNVSPSVTLAMNQLPAGGDQIPHKHNSVAVSLPIVSEGGYSLVDGEHKDWVPYATTVTPPECVHSHHNRGPESVRWLIVQDGGFYYHCRTMGFAFVD